MKEKRCRCHRGPQELQSLPVTVPQPVCRPRWRSARTESGVRCKFHVTSGSLVVKPDAPFRRQTGWVSGSPCSTKCEPQYYQHLFRMSDAPLPPFPELRPLPSDFYFPSARVVASKLLGHFILRITPQGKTRILKESIKYKTIIKAEQWQLSFAA